MQTNKNLMEPSSNFEQAEIYVKEVLSIPIELAIKELNKQLDVDKEVAEILVAEGFTTIEEVLRVVYHNEADADMVRSAGEIIALLEEPDRKDESRQLGDAKDVPSFVNSKRLEKTDNRIG